MRGPAIPSGWCAAASSWSSTTASCRSPTTCSTTRAVEPGELRLRGGDALLAELERARTGEMLDIVATIQVEQDEVIRAPLPGVLAVQGGPGSGKTAIGLHRAAFLLFNHRELARAEVLIVGPSRTYLGYIAQVLPSLGEEAVVQVTLADLVPQVRVRSVEDDEVARLKGDPRLAVVLAPRSSSDGPRPLVISSCGSTTGECRWPRRRSTTSSHRCSARAIPYRAGRAALRARLTHALAHSGDLIDPLDPKLVGADPALRALLDARWPSVSPAALVGDLFTNADRLARAADGVLDPREQAQLLRPAARTRGGAVWTHADLALVDEARDLIEGHTSTYGHVVIDEAQDLSPMELRMIARARAGGLGDHPR